MASSTKQVESDESEVTGVSRSGRICKKSSRLVYLDSSNININCKKKNKLPKRHQSSKQLKSIENNVQNQCNITNINYSAVKYHKKSTNQQKKVLKNQPVQKKPKTESSSETSLQSNSETESDSIPVNNEIQTPDYTSYDEDSLKSDEEIFFTKEKAQLEPKKVFSPNLLVESRLSSANRNFIYTGYELWSNEMKKEILKKYPAIDISIMTIRLGEMWTKMSVSERNNWHDRAQHLKEKESIQNKSIIDYTKKDWLNSCSDSGVDEWQVKQSFNEIKLRIIELQPIDVAAHLKLLGESLILIGTRLKQCDKPVVMSDCVTVLLDSLLCAMGSLICLIQQIPIFRINNSVTFLRTLENITYILPGL